MPQAILALPARIAAPFPHTFPLPAGPGRLAAFDKHLNLVLRDVLERYTVLMRGKRDGRTVRWQEARQRTLRQAFLHGSAVVSVSLHPQHASGV